MALSVGDRFGHYDVIALIGEGGMGQVYRATDTQLGRDVALKILPAAFAADPDRLARFQREAQVLASLNHPGIAQIYGIEKAGDTQALVLELVEGPTLADRLSQGAVPVDEALAIAKQMAEALEAAHEQGIIHRDLKPANIKVREDGTVKVLDFGLAKALDTTPEGDPSQSPTLTAAATQMGVIMGTAAYMAPEQARGRPVDRRADVWAFGCVLYEMLTGRRAFQGEDVSTTLADVIRAEVSWDVLPRDLTPGLVSYLRRCLHKEATGRVRDIGDVRLAMEGAFDSPARTVTAPASPRWKRIGQLALVGVAAAVVAGVTVAQWGDPDGTVVTRFALHLPGDLQVVTGPGIEFAASADGRTVVFTGNRPGRAQLYRHALDRVAPEPIAGTDGARTPFLSPDGQTVGFIADGEFRLVPLMGGPVSTVVDVPEQTDVRGVVWLPDDTFVFGTRQGLWRAPATGGHRELLTTVDREQGESFHVNPALLPDGETLVFGVFFDGPSRVETLSLPTGERLPLFESSTKAYYLPPGYLVYAETLPTSTTTGRVWAVPFDLDQLEVRGEPVLALTDVGVGDNEAQFTVSGNGTLFSVPAGGGQRGLVWVDQDGRETLFADLPSEAAYLNSVDISPDGTRLALELGEGPGSQEDSDVWTYDLQRGTLNRLTTAPGQDLSPLWTPDGRELVFGSERDNAQPGVFQLSADGTGDVVRLYLDDVLALTPKTWAFGGDALVVSRRNRAQKDLAQLSLSGEPTLETLMGSEFSESVPDVSPDGSWIVYESDRSGRREIYIERFPELGYRQLVSTDGGQLPRWSRDGRTLFYLGLQANRLMSVPVETDGELSIGDSDTLVEGQFFRFRGRSTYDIGPDGRVVLITRENESSSDVQPFGVNVVLNWHQELLERVPGQ